MGYNYYFDDSNIVRELQDIEQSLSDARSELRTYHTETTEALAKVNTYMTALMALTVLAAGLKVLFTK